MPTHSRRFLLRERTAGAHAALDAVVGPLDSPARYRRYLRGLYAFRAPAERTAAATPLPAAFDGWRPLAIAGALAADMADLDVAPVTEMALAPVEGSGLLGLVYVLEGAALGARLISRQALALGYGPRRGARHLEAQAASLASWRGFLAGLDACTPFDAGSAAAAAEAAFAGARAAFADEARRA